MALSVSKAGARVASGWLWQAAQLCSYTALPGWGVAMAACALARAEESAVIGGLAASWARAVAPDRASAAIDTVHIEFATVRIAALASILLLPPCSHY